MEWLRRHRFLALRRSSQIGILMLFWLGAHLHLGVLTGNLSSSRLLRAIPLSDPFAVLQIFASGSALSATALVGATIVLLSYWVVGGRSFCAWVCPVDIVTGLASGLRRRLGIGGHIRLRRDARYWFMGLALVLSPIVGVAAFEWISPIAMTHRELIYGVGSGILAVVAIFLLDLFALRHGWCGSLCPLGAFYSLVGRFSILRIGFAKDRCNRCGECVEVCPEPQILHFERISERGLVDSGNCLNCARCLEVCPRDAFRFALRFPPTPA